MMVGIAMPIWLIGSGGVRNAATNDFPQGLGDGKSSRAMAVDAKRLERGDATLKASHDLLRRFATGERSYALHIRSVDTLRGLSTSPLADQADAHADRVEHFCQQIEDLAGTAGPKIAEV